MIPLKLSLTHFLSYRQTATLDFNGLHLAAITGRNGAGKSSILDGVTWGLFGQSRSKSDDDIVNRFAAKEGETAEVKFDFELEGNVYRIIRRKRVGRAMLLEFMVATDYEAGEFKALTESTKRETDESIVRLLNMTYETFTNASFLLQGKADEFTTKTAGKRKEILADLLGANIWDQYKAAVSERRKAAENREALKTGQIADIETELAEEPARQAQLERATAEHERLATQLAAQTDILQQARDQEAAIRQQEALLAGLNKQLKQAEKRLNDWRADRERRQADRAKQAGVLAQGEAIQARYAAFEQAQADLESEQAKAAEASRIQALLQPQRIAIEREKSRLEQEVRSLESEKARATKSRIDLAAIGRDIETAQSDVTRFSAELGALASVQERIQTLQSEQTKIEAEQPLLKEQMKALKERIDRLEHSDEGSCPLCGQPLTAEHRESVIADIRAQGSSQGDQFRFNKGRLPKLQEEIARFETQIASRTQLERSLKGAEGRITQLGARQTQTEELIERWKSGGEARLAELSQLLADQRFLPDAQAEVARYSAELDEVGYSPDTLDRAKATRDGLRDAADAYRNWQQAQTKLESLDTQLADLDQRIDDQDRIVAEQYRQVEQSTAQLDAMTGGQEVSASVLEKQIQSLREETASAVRKVGMAEQNLRVLDDQRRKLETYSTERESVRLEIQRLKMLETACGRDGVQALLIEQALPEIEEGANQLLNKLTDGQMSLRFETQREGKTTKKLRETLDIHISDGAGVRPYENFSGGEQFRVNFALRIALSQLLARRSNAKLQTLVIDEGFGSQDPTGRQRLIEAINAIQGDFKRILIITHIDELRDAFPNRIEVSKSPTGSMISVY